MLGRSATPLCTVPIDELVAEFRIAVDETDRGDIGDRMQLALVMQQILRFDLGNEFSAGRERALDNPAHPQGHKANANANNTAKPNAPGPWPFRTAISKPANTVTQAPGRSKLQPAGDRRRSLSTKVLA